MSNDLSEATLEAVLADLRTHPPHSPLFIKQQRAPFDPAASAPTSIASALLHIIANQYEHYNRGHRDDVTPTSTWASLQFDSLDALEVAMAIEDTFDLELPDDVVETLHSLPDAVAYLTSLLAER